MSKCTKVLVLMNLFFFGILFLPRIHLEVLIVLIKNIPGLPSRRPAFYVLLKSRSWWSSALMEGWELRVAPPTPFLS
jgi:hypothetical protein